MTFKLTFDYQDWKDTSEMINSLKTFSDEEFLRTLILTNDNFDGSINPLKKPVVVYEWGKDSLEVFIHLD